MFHKLQSEDYSESVDGDAFEEEETVEERPTRSRQILLVATYIISMLSINCPAAVYNPMIDEKILTSAEAVQVVGFESYGIAFGKFFFGACSDMFGARRVMGVCFGVMSFLLLLFSAGSSVHFIAVIAFLLEAANSSIWPSHICIVRGWYSSANIAEGTRLLGFSSRGGAMLANALYGALFMLGMYWRSLLRYVTIPICIIGIFLSRLHRDTRIHSDFIGENPSLEAWKKNIKIVLSAREFWCAAASMGCCTIVKRIGVITPIFYFATSKSIISVGNSVAMGIIYQTGLLTGTIIGGHYYTKLKGDHNAKIYLMQKLNMMSTLGCVLLGCLGLFGQNSSYFILFLEAILAFAIAFGVSTSYYIIPGLFSVLFGGEKRGAMASACLDCFAYACASTFLLLQKGIVSSPIGWSGVWWTVAFFNFLVVMLVKPMERILQQLENPEGDVIEIPNM